MIYYEGIDILSLIRYRIADKPLFFSCNGANKNIYHVIKIISFWYLDQVLAFLLDLDVAIGDNLNTADAMDLSLSKVNHFINSSIVKIKMNGLHTNVDREETKDSLVTKMNKLRRTIDLNLLLLVICSFHSINLMMCSSCKEYFGNGSISIRNVIQMLYTYYTLQKEFEVEEWQQIWYNESNKPFSERFPAPACAYFEYISLSSMKFHD